MGTGGDARTEGRCHLNGAGLDGATSGSNADNHDYDDGDSHGTRNYAYRCDPALPSGGIGARGRTIWFRTNCLLRNPSA